MTKKNFYIVFAAEAASLERVKTGLYYADVMKVSTFDNVASKLEMVGGLKYANICCSKKEAEGIKIAWNESYKTNGIYAL